MNITFGICSEYEDVYRLQQMIASIDALHIPHYEIMVVGGNAEVLPHLTCASSLWQTYCSGWLPVKKNKIAREAHFDTLVLCHDYFMFDPEWYNYYLDFNEDFGQSWDVCSNPQFLINGKRHFTDWVNWDDPFYPRYYSFDYWDWSHTRHQYISGGYFLVKRDFMRLNPMNENMRPGDPEDVEWSLRIRDKATIRCNPNAIVRHNKVHRDAR